MPGTDRETLISILERALGREKAGKCLPAFDLPPSVSIRFNPGKISSPEEELSYLGIKEVSPWCKWGRDLESRPVFTLDPLFNAGCYYVQDASAMFPGMIFRRELTGNEVESLGRPLRVLDLCAAPGGKSTDLAASLRERLGDGFLLVCNEVMKSRCGILADNLAIWGDPNVVVTSCDPAAFACLEGFFDVILADVPCSGEGMFRKDSGAREEWSEDLVALCASRQKRILSSVWPALKEGGVLVYSTCTFEKEENDGIVRWVCADLGASPLYGNEGGKEMDVNGLVTTEYGYLLVPGLVPSGEGQYCSAVIKEGGCTWKKRMKAPSGDVMPASVRSCLSGDFVFSRAGDTVIAVPSVIAAEVGALSSLHPIRRGVAVGALKGRDFVPSEDLVLSLSFASGSLPSFAADKETALRYLRRDAVVLDGAPKGFVVLTYGNHPVGAVKNLGGRVNSLHPLSRRVRMEIG